MNNNSGKPGERDSIEPPKAFVSRAGAKLEHALAEFNLPLLGKTCADLGSNTGGFVDCLLQRGAMKVYAVDTGYGVLEWKLRKDPRVVVMERTNAIHVQLPELVQLISIDVAWTKQRIILPSAMRLLKPGGDIVTLVKPHYEAAAPLLRKGILQTEHLEMVIEQVKQDIAGIGLRVIGWTQSPIKGGKGNVEFLAHLRQ